jgi:multidrug efflux pump subunit AcrB
MIGIVLWGSISFIVMPKQYNPDIVAPAFVIDVDFPGATVDEVYHVVTKPLEDALNEIAGVENIYSTSVHGGRASVIAAFYIGEDLEKSTITLMQKISSRMFLKPIGVGEPSVRLIDPEDLPIKTLAFYSDTISPVELRKRALEIKEALRRAKGASIVEAIGGRHREFQIVLDPEKMKETKTSLDEIDQALDQTSVFRNIGLIKEKDYYYHLDTQEQVATVQDIENIVIAANVEQNLRIKDVGAVIEGEEEYNNYVSYYKSDLSYDNVVYVAIAKIKGQNILTVSRNIDRTIKDLAEKTDLFKDIHMDTVMDEGRVAGEEISKLITNLIQAIGIVFFVLLIFLNYRAAIIVAVSIPLTLLTVFGIGNLCGYTINRITLFALILSLGMLVDSATVVVENIVRGKKLNPDEPKSVLIARAVSEVGVGLFLSTATTVIAFIPMAFVTGMMGPYMGPLPFFVFAALLVSLLFAYTLNPWLAYLFCKDDIEPTLPKKCGVACSIATKGLNLYKKILTNYLENKGKRRFFLICCFVVLMVVLTFPVLQLLRFRMLPKADREQMYVYVDLERGASLERSQVLAQVLAKQLLKEPSIVSVQSFVGTPPILDFNGLFKNVSNRQGSHQITFKINITHPNDRREFSEKLAGRYREILSQALRDHPRSKLQIIEDPPGPPVQSTFVLKVKSEDEALLEEVALDLKERAKKIKEVKDIDLSLEEDVVKYVLTINKIEVARSKISVEAIAEELMAIFQKDVIGVYHSSFNLEQEYIVLKFERALRDNINDLNSVYIINALGNHVPLSRFVDIKEVEQEKVILSDNRERALYITGEMGRRSVTYACLDLLGELLHYSVPGKRTKLVSFTPLRLEYLVDGSRKVVIELGGEWELTVKVFRDLGIAMMVAIVFIYLLLVAQFKSFSIAFLILVTIPLALIGVIPGFALLFFTNGVYFSATSMIGVIALAGIVVNNAIIFIEYLMQAIPQQASLVNALKEAGATRLRPIVVTSATTVLGTLTIASDPVWAGLAWSIFFGLSLSTGLTLIVFPLLVHEFLGSKWFESIKRGNR